MNCGMVKQTVWHMQHLKCQSTTDIKICMRYLKIKSICTQQMIAHFLSILDLLKENGQSSDLLLVYFFINLFRLYLFENKIGPIIKSVLQIKSLYFIFTPGYLKRTTTFSHNLRMRFLRCEKYW